MTGAAIVYSRLSSAWAREMVNRIGRILLGICTASFSLEQGLYLGATANLVPKWLLPSQMFWAIATTVLFALAAVGASYESNGTTRASPTDDDAGDIGATRAGAGASSRSPQAYELERNRRDLRDCRNSVDSH